MRDKKYIQSIQRASMILNCLSERGAVKLNEICQITGLKTSTAFGIVKTLEEVGQISRINDGLHYTLGINSLKFALSYINNFKINDEINILLKKLVAEIDETAYVMMKVGKSSYYYLDSILSSHPLKAVPHDEKFIELPDISAVGKIFKDNNLEYALDIGEVYEGMNCIAIPYRVDGTLIASIVIAGPDCRFTEEKVRGVYNKYLGIINQ